jgi:hypothetical protein
MLETYGEVIDRDTTVVLSTDSEMFRLLKTQELAPAGAKPAVPVPAVPALPAAVPVPAGP